MNDLAIIQRSLTSRLFSTVTTILMVAIAVALLLTLLGLRDSGNQAMQRGAGNMHLVISRDSSPLESVLNTVFYANPPRRAIEWEKFEEIRGMFPFHAEGGYAIPTQQGDSYRGFPVLATTEEFFTKFQPQPQMPWEFLEGSRPFQRPFEVVIGDSVARGAGLRLGDRIHLTHGIDVSRQARLARPSDEIMEPHVHDDFEYEVVGILAPTGTLHDRALFTDLYSTWVIHAHDIRRAADPRVTRTTVDDLREEDRLITGILIRVPGRPTAQRGGRAGDAPAALQQVHDMLRRDTTITVAAPRHQIDRLRQIIGNIDQILIAMAAAVLIASAVSIMLALYNSMDQRRRQIAVLRVLGCSRQRIFALVLTESAVLGLLGAAVGIVLALIGLQIVADLMYVQFGLVIEPQMPARLGLTVVVATILLAALAGLIPAASAYRTPVVKNLRPLG